MSYGLDQYGAATFDRREGRAQDRPLATCEARLTLTSGTPYPTADQSAVAQVYFTPTGRGSRVELYDTNVNQWVPRTLAAEISVACPSTLFRLYDLYAYWTGSAIALEAVSWNQSTGSITAASAANPCVVTSTAHGLSANDLVGITGVTGTLGTDTNNGINGRVWTVLAVPTADTFSLMGSDTSGLAYTANGTWYKVPNTRATALTTQNGRYVKAGDASRLYLGTGMTRDASGQTENTASRRLLWNAYNPQLLPLRAVDATDSWSYSTAAFRPANNRIANRVEMVRGLNEQAVAARVKSFFSSTVDNDITTQTIGLNRTNAADAQLLGEFASSAIILGGSSSYEGFPGLGYSYLQWIEYSSGTGTFYGDAGAAGVFQSGLQAWGWF